MVDAVVSFVVEKLGDALIGETFFLLGVRTQMEGLRDELRRMQCFLKDADVKAQQGDERVRNWVSDIRNLAYDAEDVIDTFILNAESNRKTGGIRNFLTRKALMLKNMGYLHRVGKEILAIQARLKDISESTITYGIQNLQMNEASNSRTNQSMIPHPLRNRYPHVEDNDVIGFEEHTKTLLTELMKDEEEHRIVSIVGVGGLGKTTLAKKIYRHETVASHFDCCGWSSISQQLDMKNALREIMKCMSLQDGGYPMEELYNYLQDKRYLIVLDDVWKVDHWNSLSPAFPAGMRGSKVLLTTRNKEVALHADPWSLHLEPQFLTDNESWALLCKKAFPRSISASNCYPVDLGKLGREMVLKCGGLPLAICVLGGLLATKRSDIKQWELVHRDVISSINKGGQGGVSGILALSYYDLPSHLKPCFLYLGLFPEDYAIPTKELIQFWMAEGFIPHTRENLVVPIEDIGKHHYLGELVQRCMIQLGKEGPTAYEYRVVRVHDLMRDLCLSKAKEINFLNIHDLQHRTVGDIQTSTNAVTRVRRYAIHFNNPRESYLYDDRSNCVIRTLFVLNRTSASNFPLRYQNLKLLRVLELHFEYKKPKTNTTREVSKLIHLRYLNLSDLFGSSVSSSIGNLRNLETLKLNGYGFIPESISKLVQLRHLYLSSLRTVDQNFRIENLINLHTIHHIQAGEWIRKGCLEKLSNLRKLCVWHTSRLQNDIIVDEVSKRSSVSSSSSSSDDQNLIKSLFIYTEKGFPNSIFDSLSCCHNLRRLELFGGLDILNLKKYPPNLTKLYLTNSSFVEDPMATLQCIPKLRKLILVCCDSKVEEMVCPSTGFPELKYLLLSTLTNVREWRIEQGGMSHLNELVIIRWSELNMLPEGLKFITTLEKLKISDTPSIIERATEGTGEDWYKIQHIPSIVKV